jgi:hypothetical protein
MAVYHKEKLLPAGEYEVEVMHANLSRSVTGQNEMLVVVLHVPNEEGRWSFVRDYLVFSEKSYWKFDTFLKAVGLDLEDGEEIDPDDFVGLVARAQVGTRDFGNREQNCVERWLPKMEDAPATGN